MEMLKSIWRASPQSARLLFCQALCCFFAQKRPEQEEFSDAEIVCGAFSSASGLGRGATLYADDLERAGRDVIRVDITKAMRMPRDLPTPGNVWPIVRAAQANAGRRVVIHANPPQLQLALCALGREFLSGKRLVGYWAWELEAFPAIWKQALDYLDEVEVPSRFVADALRKITKKPVTLHPHPLRKPARRKTEYAKDGIVRCLNIFDARSGWERKNPEAALRAFAGAFKPGSAKMTFKISHAEARRERLEKFCEECAQVPGVTIETGILDSSGMEELYLEHDIYLSLHRSEGFGLPIAEAMGYGLHAVATGWSGNMDFMRGALAHPAACKLVPAVFEKGPCKGLQANWAEADAEAAIEVLKNIDKILKQIKSI